MRAVVPPVVFVLLLAATLASAVQPALATSDAWVKLPADGVTATAAFVTVSNPSMYDAYLVDASSDVAGEVHFRRMVPGAEPATVKEATIPAYDKLEMSPSGLHVWLSALKRPLKAGESITLALTTDTGATLQVTAVVK